jgi:hypothetical protein
MSTQKTASHGGRGHFHAGKFFLLLLAVTTLCGCMRRYDVILTNGRELTNVRKPALNKEGGYFYYINAHGQTNTIPATRVVEIRPHQESKGQIQQ